MSIDASDRLAGIDIGGTPFGIGRALGRHGAAVVHRHLVRTHAWAFVTGFRDAPGIRAALAAAEARFPSYVEELHGLADGLGLPFDALFAWNCRGDVWAMSPDGCTTVQLPGATPLIAHNEDGDPGLRPGCALASVKPDHGRAYTAFVYPASIPGHTFAVNDAGLVITVNNIRSRDSGPGLPRMLITRALLDCGTIAEAVELLETLPRASAFHLTLARAGESTVLSVEFTHRILSATPVSRPSAHANHLIHARMMQEAQIVTGSSKSRQERCNELIAAAGPGALDPVVVLADTHRKALPIFRTQPDDPDNENTLATAIFEIGADEVDCTVYDGSDRKPRFRFRCSPSDPIRKSDAGSRPIDDFAAADP